MEQRTTQLRGARTDLRRTTQSRGARTDLTTENTHQRLVEQGGWRTAPKLTTA